MSSSEPGVRFREIQRLLSVYAEFGYTFTDTSQRPGPALEAYLSASARSPEQAAATVRQLRDLLSAGLFSEEVADEVALFPHILPTGGRSVEDSFGVIIQHIEEWLNNPVIREGLPASNWEWREAYPAVFHLIGAYFHQDFHDEYSSHREAVDEYVRDTPDDDRRNMIAEMRELLQKAPDPSLQEAVRALGLEVAPPRGRTLRQWLADLADIVEHMKC